MWDFTVFQCHVPVTSFLLLDVQLKYDCFQVFLFILLLMVFHFERHICRLRDLEKKISRQYSDQSVSVLNKLRQELLPLNI